MYAGWIAACAAISAFCCVVGVIRDGARRLDWPVLFAAALVSLFIAVLAFRSHESDVSSGQALGGGLLAGAVVAVPLVGYYAMGRVLAGFRSMLVVLWALSQMLLVVYALAGLFIVAALTSCPPGAYECPV